MKLSIEVYNTESVDLNDVFFFFLKDNDLSDEKNKENLGKYKYIVIASASEMRVCHYMFCNDDALKSTIQYYVDKFYINNFVSPASRPACEA